MLAIAATTENGKIAYVANTYQQAKDISWEELKEAAAPITIKTNESDLQIIVRSTIPKREQPDPKHPNRTPPLILNKDNKPIYVPSQSTIRLRGWESVNNLRGQKFHFLVLDEVAFMKEFTSTWNKVLLPALTDYTGRALFLSTPDGFNHFYTLYNREHKDLDYKSFHFPSRKNPYLKGEVIDKAKREMTEDEFAQEYEGEFRRKEGLVYKTFNRVNHTYTAGEITLPHFTETFYGVDFGFTNPSAVLVIQKDGDANYWVTDMIYERKLTNTQLIEKTKQLQPQPRYIYADPAEPDRIQEFKNSGYYMREVRKGKGSVEFGINRLQELFKTNRIRIDATHCISLIEELEMYSYPNHKEGNNEKEKPIPEFDHSLDALSYSLRTHDPSSHGRGDMFWKKLTNGEEPSFMQRNMSVQEGIKQKINKQHPVRRDFE